MATERTNTKRVCLEMLGSHPAKLPEKLVRHAFSSLAVSRECAAVLVELLACSTLDWQLVIADKIKLAASRMRFMMRLFRVLTDNTITFYTMTLHVQFAIH